MGVLKDCINNKKIESIPIWFMRQAGRYLPEFRKIRYENTDFIKLCLNPGLSKEITLQPLRRYPIDAAIIFSDILLIPYALGQRIEFKKGFGPKLGDLDLKNILNISDEQIFNKLKPVYELVKTTSITEELKNKDLIGFIGGTWTLLVYMINKKSPKNTIINDIYGSKNLDDLLKKLIQTQKLHIKYQVENGASIIQIFDSWAGLIKKDKLDKFIYEPTKELVEYTKSLNVEAICFPRNIESYKEYCNIVKPSAINIDYEVDPKKIVENIDIPVQGGMNPKYLLFEKNEMLKNAEKYLEIFKNHKYIFNLGHGVLPETNPENIRALVDFVKEFK